MLRLCQQPAVITDGLGASLSQSWELALLEVLFRVGRTLSYWFKILSDIEAASDLISKNKTESKNFAAAYFSVRNNRYETFVPGPGEQLDQHS